MPSIHDPTPRTSAICWKVAPGPRRARTGLRRSLICWQASSVAIP